MSQSEVSKMAIAVPCELHAWVRAEAHRQDRSLNAVIVRMIRSARDRAEAEQKQKAVRS